MKLRKIKRLFYYLKLYGFLRVLAKIGFKKKYRLPFYLIKYLSFKNANFKRIAIIGCGQQAYTSICLHLSLFRNIQIIFASDRNLEAAKFLVSSYGGTAISLAQIEDKFQNNNIDIVYIASNHASHYDYAELSSKYVKNIFIEKPLDIDIDKILKYEKLHEKGVNIYAGYNRPFSSITDNILSKLIPNSPITLNMFVVGHKLPSDHWYFNSSEGTRLGSNIGHWLDFSIHILSHIRKTNEIFDYKIDEASSGNECENMTIILNNSFGDHVSITFSVRGEPFLGVSEVICIQQNETIIVIDDFSSLKIQDDRSVRRKKFFFKKLGQKECVIAPITNISNRDWNDIRNSSLLTLELETRYKGKQYSGVIDMS